MSLVNYALPHEIVDAMDQYAHLYINISGGKDSQALAIVTDKIARGFHWHNVSLLHMNLGRAEWRETPAHVQYIAEMFSYPLEIISRPQGDLVQDIEDRLEKLKGTGKPFWPSAMARYCTSHHKRNQADKLYRKHKIVISAEGIRAEESRNRANKPHLSIRKAITAKALRDLTPAEALRQRTGKQRVGLTWYPLLDYTLDEIWTINGHSTNELIERQQAYRQGFHKEALDGWMGHPAYVYGNQRLSCALCILATTNDLENGARHQPELFNWYYHLEKKGNATFKNGWSLGELLSSNHCFIESPAEAQQYSLFNC